MRRPAVLAFGLFALAACLPAEVRECLPMSTACEHRARVAGISCPRGTPGEARPACSLARKASVDCPRAQRPPEAENCRLHPTPDATPTRDPIQVAAPTVADLPVPPVELVEVDATRDGWLEAQESRPRASPLAAPLAPRPPPVAA